MAVTMKQIAARCGLSLPTVSYVLNGKDELFRPATKERVWAAARELGYRPNSAALAMRSGKFSSIGLVIGIQSKPTYMPFAGVEGMHDQLAEVDYHLVVSRLSAKIIEEGAELPKLLRQWMVDGLIVNFTENAKDVPERLEKLVDEYQIPAIWLNDKRPHNAVYPDDFQGGKKAAEYLLGLGHRRVGFLGIANPFGLTLEDRHYSQLERRNGVIETVRAAGATAMADDLAEPPHRLNVALKMLEKTDRPTAIVTYGHGEAICVLQAALTLGMNVPRDLSIMTFANNYTETIGLNFTRIRVPEYEMGREAAKMVLERIKKPVKSLPTMVMDMPLREGESCAKPKA